MNLNYEKMKKKKKKIAVSVIIIHYQKQSLPLTYGPQSETHFHSTLEILYH